MRQGKLALLFGGILAVTLVAATAIILLNLVADLVLLWLDPTVTRKRGRGMSRLVGRAA